MNTVVSIAAAAAAVAGSAGAGSALNNARVRAQRRKLHSHATGGARAQKTVLCGGVYAYVLERACAQSRNSAVNIPAWMLIGVEALEARACLAGLAGRATRLGLCLTRAQAAFVCGGACAVVGAIVSLQCAAIGAVVGLCVGWRLLMRAMTAEAAARKRMLEGHLSQAVEVLCLGLRSGLSFDRALTLYCNCFPSMLARQLALAQAEWEAGLRTREEALREVAASYDSALFGRLVDGIVRSMRFGSPLADVLESLAAEARAAHKAAVEEAVMKAPVKMMVPVGVLILPSMLLLVLGPVLLGLFE